MPQALRVLNALRMKVNLYLQQQHKFRDIHTGIKYLFDFI